MIQVIASIGVAAYSLAARPALARCEISKAPALDRPSGKRAISILDLATLRDIGSSDSSNLSQASPLSVSPDGQKVAFILTQGNPATNKICREMLLLDLDGVASPRSLDVGGEPILVSGDYRGLLVVTGASETVRPSWSGDGRSIAYLRRDNGSTQVWRADLDGGRSVQVTQAVGDVDQVAWAKDGRTLIYSVRSGEAALRPLIDNEALTGWHYDGRMTPNRGIAPQVPAGLQHTVYALEPGGTAPRPATAVEVRELASGHAAGPAAEHFGLESPDGLPLTPLALWGRANDGRRVHCPDPLCRSDIVGLYPEPSGRSALFLRREGWAHDRLTLYQWRPDSGRSPSKRWTTASTLLGCQLVLRRLVCLHETSSTPRTIVSIAPDSGRMRKLYDPNPQFRDLMPGKVVPLHWQNDLGLKARGDLVLPGGVRPKGGWPLIVVQYHSQGFQRGGTGDEVPIFPLAAHGFAVLSVEQPTIVATLASGLRTFDQVNAYNAQGWAERRSLLSSLLIGVDTVVARGDADPAKVGITGLSDGATSVAFALINAHAFAAASISTCCTEPWSIMAFGGPAWADNLRSRGYPAASANESAFWAPMSLAANAAHIHTPLMMQVADDEYLLALQSFAALREQHQPVDMFVFPDEHHVKWQPRHRLAVYDRNIDWFAFWLRHEEDPAPAKRAQYEHWRSLRDARPGGG